MTQTNGFVRLILTSVLAVALMITAMPVQKAFAIDADEFAISGIAALSDNDMGMMRAGYRDSLGMIYRFAVDIKSEINGILEFTRSIVLARDSAGQLYAQTNSNIQNVNIPSGGTLKVDDNARAFSYSDEKGSVKIENQTSTGVITSVIMNNSDGVQASQKIDLDLTLQNMAPMMDNVRSGGRHSINGLRNAFGMGGFSFRR